MGGTFVPKLVTRAYFSFIFCAGSIFESIFEAKMLPVLRLRWVEVKGRRQRRSPAEGGEASLQSFCKYFINSLARPATSAEVRRIKRAAPRPPTHVGQRGK